MSQVLSITNLVEETTVRSTDTNKPEA